jgi:Concanavalin A-like lectin/glucanases superfamily
MYQLVLHHTYIGGSTVDVSGLSNHGIPQDVTPGTGDALGSYEFGQPGSGILVPASPSLTNLTAVRVRMKVRPEPWDGERRNLMEGFVSFAFALDGDGHLSGSIVDGSGAWTGVSAAGALSPEAWHEVELVHDGVSTLALKVDAGVVAVRRDVRGPVRSVGLLGIAIGRWPDANEYVFKGHIGELQVWRFDPFRTALQFLDCCCDRDPDLLDEVLADLRDRGVDWARLRVAAAGLQQENLDLAAAVRAATTDGATVLDEVLVALRTAMLRRSRVQLAALHDRAEAVVDSSAGVQRRAEYEQRVTEIAASLGWDRRRLDRLVAALCLDVLAPPQTPDPTAPPGRAPDPWDDVRTPEPFSRPDADGR